jgi:hypothetical protein
MRRNLGIIREAAGVIEDAANRAIRSYKRGSVEHEPSLTDRMLGRIEEAMASLETKGIVWQAKTLTSQVKGSQEKRYGADFAGVAQLSLPGYAVAKGFLAQGKRLEPGRALDTTEFQRTKRQCHDMLERTPESRSCFGSVWRSLPATWRRAKVPVSDW